MNVKLTSSIAGDRFSFRPSQVIACSDRQAAQLIAHGVAVKADNGAPVEGRLPDRPPTPRKGGAPKETAALGVPETPEPDNGPAKCKGMTTLGHPCKRAPSAGSDYCAKHQSG